MQKVSITLLFLVFVQLSFSQIEKQNAHKLYVGWSSKSITPDSPVALAGQFQTRISYNIMDSVTCTALAIETRDIDKSIESALLISVDLVDLRDGFEKQIKEGVREKLPDFNLNKVIINVTHTHTAPVVMKQNYAIPPEAIQPNDYRNFVVEQIAIAAAEAWENRTDAGMSWGLGQAVVGYNRRTVYSDPIPSMFGTGTTVMYGKTNREDFSHIEGHEDNGMEMLFFWDIKKKLTGIVINIACPAQETESISQVSADFWHEARTELRKKFGENVYILPQVAAAGDISPHLIWRKKAEEIMLKRKGITRRQEIGKRIARAVEDVFPYVQGDIKRELVFRHIYNDIALPVKRITRREAANSAMLSEEEPDNAFWHQEIVNRYNTQNSIPFYSARVNVLRLGEVIMASNPFELFVDYGVRIKAQSRAVLTMLVQLANGAGAYLPTAKAEAGKGYSAIIQSNLVGSDGGQILVEETLDMIDSIIK
ncbi:hypothetical protein [Massilibacteroides vaginae]|uniref:hypothetical protein n=1 Tax=Massilibacteroides vaginae TaxID=1673718 RepID=UPI000A1CC146|nr:hypothetical protein [Massilibacteroides vaginae]